MNHVGGQIWFSRSDEIGTSYQFNEMIFFGNGSIKLRENYYIHKGILLFTFVHMYYYKKFQRVKEQYINQHKFRERMGRLSSPNQQTNTVGTFKFLKG